MTVLHLIPRDTRTELWIAAGMKRPYRVTSDRLTYGEFDQLDDARAFLALLLLGNPERFRGIGGVRVIVCGSRRWNDRARVEYRLAELPGDTTIVVGYNPAKNTPKGVDRFAYQEAQKLGLTVEPHPAEWEKHGKKAGYLRNAEMADSGADLCIAFWDGLSDGTRHMMTLAEMRDIPIEEIRS